MDELRCGGGQPRAATARLNFLTLEPVRDERRPAADPRVLGAIAADGTCPPTGSSLPYRARTRISTSP